MPDPVVSWVGCHPSNFDEERAGVAITALAMHEAEGTLAQTDDWFNRYHMPPAGPSSAHYCIAQDGRRIHQYVRDGDTAFSNGILIAPNTAAVPWLKGYRGNPNHTTLAFEFEGAHVWKNGIVGGTVLVWYEPTEPQYQAALWLARRKVAEHRITVDRAHITRHSDYNSSMGPGGKGWCPGRKFPLQRLLDDLASSEMLHVDYQAALGKIGDALTVKGAPTISPDVFRAVLEEKHSPAAPYADALYRVCVRNYVNPAVALAFFHKESQMGTDRNGLAVRTKNWGNIVADQSRGELAIDRYWFPAAQHYFRVYDSWEHGLEDWCRLWNLGVYTQYRGQPDELKKQIARYAPGDDGNNPGGYYQTVRNLATIWLNRSGDFDYEAAL